MAKSGMSFGVRGSRRHAALLAGWILAMVLPALTQAAQPRLAATPPMGWNDWAHYQCDYDAGTILANARALVRTGLAARGYRTVTIDDCWMLKDRDSRGDLQPDPHRFPHGMRTVAATVHALGLRFGIYEDAGSDTCAGFAGSGTASGGEQPHFLTDARLFASWGVDYLKLDGCNVHPARGAAGVAAYRRAYHAQSAALAQAGRPIVFSESAPAYFQGSEDWYDVLGWVRGYGQLWREGTDVEIYDRKMPHRSRFGSVMWNYAYNLQLGRYQRPGNWNDADFIIGGDKGMTLAETRSQLALWSMMSAPLILSSDIDRLSPAAISILGNREVLSVDQDRLGIMASLVRRSASMDLLLKPLRAGGYAVAALNRGPTALRLQIRAGELGFGGGCRLQVRDLWSGARQASAASFGADIQPHDTDIWKVRPTGACAKPARVGLITRTVQTVPQSQEDAEHYTRCLSSTGTVRSCLGTAAESWRILPDGALRSGRECLAAAGPRAVLATCRPADTQRWRYTLAGNLINRASHLCLTGRLRGALAVQACGHNLGSQVWTLPGGVTARQAAP